MRSPQIAFTNTRSTAVPSNKLILKMRFFGLWPGYPAVEMHVTNRCSTLLGFQVKAMKRSAAPVKPA